MNTETSIHFNAWRQNARITNLSQVPARGALRVESPYDVNIPACYMLEKYGEWRLMTASGRVVCKVKVAS